MGRSIGRWDRALTALILLCSTHAWGTYSFTGLGRLSGSGSYTATAVSDDGSFVAGTANPLFEGQVAVRWNGPGSMIILRMLSGYSASYGTDISADGTVVVGYCTGDGTNSQAFRWTDAGGMVGLGDLPGGQFSSRAYGVSSAGSVVVGYGGASNLANGAFRWTSSTGMVALGYLPGTNVSAASAVSPDGGTIVGTSAALAFRWQSGTGMSGLGNLPNGSPYPNASGVSSGGSVIVGTGNGVAYRWANGTGSFIGTLSGSTNSFANNVSSDGLTLVGGTNTPIHRAFLWHPAYGTVDLKEFLLAHGVSAVANWQLDSAVVSRNGRFLVGSGSNPNGASEAWIAEIDVPMLPRAYAVTVGYPYDGDLESLYAAEGNEVCLFPDENSFEGEINFYGTSPVERPSSFTFRLVSEAGRLGLSQVVRLRNYATDTYDLVDGRVAPNIPTTVSVTLTHNVSDYVGPNRALRARVNWAMINDEAPSQDGWPLCVDVAMWTVSP
ncbi:MAG: hypothetical protein U0S12_08305 [Fimbriimonadales bacterium]